MAEHPWGAKEGCNNWRGYCQICGEASTGDSLYLIHNIVKKSKLHPLDKDHLALCAKCYENKGDKTLAVEDWHGCVCGG